MKTVDNIEKQNYTTAIHLDLVGEQVSSRFIGESRFAEYRVVAMDEEEKLCLDRFKEKYQETLNSFRRDILVPNCVLVSVPFSLFKEEWENNGRDSLFAELSFLVSTGVVFDVDAPTNLCYDILYLIHLDTIDYYEAATFLENLCKHKSQWFSAVLIPPNTKRDIDLITPLLLDEDRTLKAAIIGDLVFRMKHFRIEKPMEV